MIACILLAVVLGTIGLSWFTPEGKLALRQWRLFVPLVVGWAAATVLALLGAHAAFFTAGPQLPLLPSPLVGNVSLSMALLVVIEVFVMAWATPLLQKVAAGERAVDHLLPGLRQAPALLPRMFVAWLLGRSVPLLALAGVLHVCGGEIGLVCAVVVVLGLAPLWSTLTGPLVFELLDRRRSIGEVLHRSLQIGRRDGIHWGGLVFLQAALAGALVVWPEHLSVHANWYGGYAIGSHWVEQLQPKTASPGHLALATIVSGCTAWFVLAIKLRIAGVLQQRANGGHFVTVDRQGTGAVRVSPGVSS